MRDRDNDFHPMMEEKRLQEILALQWQQDHPAANYRLGYLYFRRRAYTKAVSFFEGALDGCVEE
ncbi:hypothetical protein P9D43_29330 [Neobacillus niacini]|uniref:hypothetical protein n=1 Tax=Neobacillus niacini TaxID=86668 RepID=UPI00052FAFB2|nr:hypothetical protein [Neobacillus niacini]KGM45732.1 hypothetical protein NP83_04280 [Neobacillus niacini]MEC1526095.1 hypothetical protein [Neobacillus niacini]